VLRDPAARAAPALPAGTTAGSPPINDPDAAGVW
jgi:hypothetical protein